MRLPPSGQSPRSYRSILQTSLMRIAGRRCHCASLIPAGDLKNGDWRMFISSIGPMRQRCSFNVFVVGNGDIAPTQSVHDPCTGFRSSASQKQDCPHRWWSRAAVEIGFGYLALDPKRLQRIQDLIFCEPVSRIRGGPSPIGCPFVSPSPNVAAKQPVVHAGRHRIFMNNPTLVTVAAALRIAAVAARRAKASCPEPTTRSLGSCESSTSHAARCGGHAGASEDQRRRHDSSRESRTRAMA